MVAPSVVNIVTFVEDDEDVPGRAARVTADAPHVRVSATIDISHI